MWIKFIRCGNACGMSDDPPSELIATRASRKDNNHALVAINSDAGSSSFFFLAASGMRFLRLLC
jgi:hypothetical protein